MFLFNVFKRVFIYSIPVYVSKFKSCAFRGLFHSSILFTTKAVSQPADHGQESVTDESAKAKLSDKVLLQRANSATVASTSQLLIIYSTLLIEYHKKYRAKMENVLFLMNDILIYINSEPHQEKLWNEMVAARAEANVAKMDLAEMQSHMEYIEKLVTAVAEAAYLADSVFASTSICELFNSTQQKLEMESSKTNELESEYHQQHKSLIETMAKKGKVPELVERSD